MSPYTHTHKREINDTAEDILLFLYLLKRAGNNVSGNNAFEAQKKLMKLVFLAEKEMIDKQYKGFNFFFNVFKYGPSSMEVLRLADDLKERGLIEFDNANFTYTLASRGRSLINEFEKEEGRDNNKVFFEAIDKIISKYGSLTTQEIIEKVYAMKIVPLYGKKPIEIGKAVKDGKRDRLFMKLENARKEFSVSKDWVATVNILMNSSLADLV